MFVGLGPSRGLRPPRGLGTCPLLMRVDDRRVGAIFIPSSHLPDGLSRYSSLGWKYFLRIGRYSSVS